LRGAAEMPRVPPRISLHSSRPTCRRRVLSALPQAIAPELLFAHRTLRHPRVTRSSLAALPAQGPRGQSGGLPLGAKGAWASVTAPTAPRETSTRRARRAAERIAVGFVISPMVIGRRTLVAAGFCSRRERIVVGENGALDYRSCRVSPHLRPALM